MKDGINNNNNNVIINVITIIIINRVEKIEKRVSGVGREEDWWKMV